MCLHASPHSAKSGHEQYSLSRLTEYVPFPDCDGTCQRRPTFTMEQVSAMTRPRSCRALATIFRSPVVTTYIYRLPVDLSILAVYTFGRNLDSGEDGSVAKKTEEKPIGMVMLPGCRCRCGHEWLSRDGE